MMPENRQGVYLEKEEPQNSELRGLDQESGGQGKWSGDRGGGSSKQAASEPSSNCEGPVVLRREVDSIE